MRNLLITLLLCGVVQAAASAGCPAAPVAPPQGRPAAELISSAAAQGPVGTAAAQPAGMMVPASVHAGPTQVMGGPPGAVPMNESPRRGSRLAMVLAAVGVMLVIVLRRLGASG